MFCPNCGKEVKENDNFCRYCGNNLHTEIETINVQKQVCTADTIKMVNVVEKIDEQPVIKNSIKEKISDDAEEVVLYVVKKHWIDLIVPICLVPLFFLYFWNIFLNTHSLFSWVVLFALLGFIFYPVARYKSDRMVVTNKFIHIKSGILNPEEADIPIENANALELTQSTMGRIFDYGLAAYISSGERKDYGSIKAPENLEYIIENPDDFVRDNMD